MFDSELIKGIIDWLINLNIPKLVGHS